MSILSKFTAQHVATLCSHLSLCLMRSYHKLFPTYESCRGLSLPAIGKYKIEFWYCKSGYEIQPHSHNNIDIKLFFLFGHRISFYRRRRPQVLPDFFYAKWWHILSHFNIRAGDIHYFKVSKYPLIFMNLEIWQTKPTSASIDFTLTHE